MTSINCLISVVSNFHDYNHHDHLSSAIISDIFPSGQEESLFLRSTGPTCILYMYILLSHLHGSKAGPNGLSVTV